jgi:hypothetical protein
VGRIKLVYWALIAVLGALVVFLLSAAARLLRDRRGYPPDPTSERT